MIRSCAAIFFLFSFFVASAQSVVFTDETVPVHAVKFSPFHLLSFYPTIQVAYEFRLRNPWTLQLDGGVGINTNCLGENVKNFHNKKGYKLKVEPRYYFKSDVARNLTFYSASEFYFNRFKFDHANTQKECFDGACADQYTRRYHYRAMYQEMGLALKVGMVIYLFEKLMLDYNLGIGLRSINYTFPSYIRLEEDDAIWEIPKTNDRLTLTPIMNFRIGYRIK